METLKIELRNKKQSSMIKELLKELNIRFEPVFPYKAESPYGSDFVAKIKRGKKREKKVKGLK